MLHTSSLVDLMGMHCAQVCFLHLTPSATPDNAQDDADADNDWQEDVKEDDGGGGLPAVIVIVVVIAKTIFVIHLLKERNIDLSLLESGRNGCNQTQCDSACFVERFHLFFKNCL